MYSVLNRIGQAGKEKSLFLLTVIAIFLVGSNGYGQRVFTGALGQLNQNVTIYEEGNFKGRSRTFSVGEYTLSDFDAAVSSIKVPAGLVAMVYENAAGNGSGVWVGYRFRRRLPNGFGAISDKDSENRETENRTADFRHKFARAE